VGAVAVAALIAGAVYKTNDKTKAANGSDAQQASAAARP
jgi:hypothetical protein